MQGRWGPIVLWGGLLVYPLVVAQTDSAEFLQDVGATLVLMPTYCQALPFGIRL